MQSVLDGYNGTVMAYGQTGTGKTYTLGRLGEEDIADRGIMLRAMEDILTEVSPGNDLVSVSYLQVLLIMDILHLLIANRLYLFYRVLCQLLSCTNIDFIHIFVQLYMETIQDLLNPANDNISIVEDPKSGDVALPGATVVEIRDHKSFMELLQLGEAHRYAANTKLNTESSRSHAILMVYKIQFYFVLLFCFKLSKLLALAHFMTIFWSVCLQVNIKRSVRGRNSSFPGENGNMTVGGKTLKPPIVRKSKLVIVDLAGSERIDKSGITLFL